MVKITTLVLCSLLTISVVMSGCASSSTVKEIKIEMEPEKPISIQVTPPSNFVNRPGERAGKRIVIRISEHPDNIRVRLDWTSPDGEEGASERPLEGKNSPHIIEESFFFGRQGFFLSPGSYTVRVTLIRRNGESFSVQVETQVTLPGNGQTRR